MGSRRAATLMHKRAALPHCPPAAFPIKQLALSGASLRIDSGSNPLQG